MTTSDRHRTQITFLILLLSAITWVMLLVSPLGVTLNHCPVSDSDRSLASFQMLLQMNPISSLVIGWTVMLIAMMLPTLIQPIHHVRERSFKRRRLRSVALFVAGYAVIWMLAGALLLTTIMVLNWVLPGSYLPPIIVGTIALVWQCSPTKQRCLNRSHNHRALKAFGVAADLDALRFGIAHGVWCVGSCWALMLLPMVITEGHLAAMAAVSFLMISERLERPMPLAWRLSLRGKLLRILIAQTRIRLHALL